MDTREIYEPTAIRANTRCVMSEIENPTEPAKNPDEDEWELLKKERRVVELRQMGITYEVIAKEVGYAGASGAYHAYERALARYPRETFDKKRDLQDQRIERLLAGIYTRALRGEIPAVMAAIKLFERQAKLLGLDAAQKIESTVEIFEGGSAIDEQVRRFAYLIAEVENNSEPLGFGESVILGVESAPESNTLSDGVENMADSFGSRVGEDSMRGRVDSVGSDTPTEDSLGGSGEDL